MGHEKIEPDEIEAALEELQESQGISRSPNLGDVLRYVVRKTLDGQAGAIKAYSIAVDVLGRPASFDPQSDPIVRVQARRLRMAIEEFYASGASRSPVQIRLPVGRYVPEFVRISVPDGISAEVAPSVRASPRSMKRPLPWATLAASLVLMLVGIAVTVVLLRWILPPNTPARSAATSGIPDFQPSPSRPSRIWCLTPRSAGRP